MDLAHADVVVRRAGVADARALAEGRYRFRSETNASGPIPAGVPIEDRAQFVARAASRIALHLEGGRWFAWIAEQEQRMVGHVFFQLIDKLPNPSPEEPEVLGYLTSFYVDANLRGRGVGSMMLDALEAHARDLGAEKVIISGTTPGSRTLYARRGFRSTPDLLEKRL